MRRGAVREDVLPTLARVAASGRWSSVIAHLPVGTAPELVCEAISQTSETARRMRVIGVLVGVDGSEVTEDLLSDTLLAERGVHTSDDDRRGLGEVLAGMIEYADATVLVSGSDPTGPALVRTLARPGAVVLDDTTDLDAGTVRSADHEMSRSDWVAPDRSEALPTITAADVWRADLRSERPFHPERLLAGVGRLGAGRHRSRGCFWLPSRPGGLGVWDGAGGQLSVGAGGRWRNAAHTRIVVVGTGPRPHHLEEAFEWLLVTPNELRSRGQFWELLEDGLEPWLGPIRRVA